MPRLSVTTPKLGERQKRFAEAYASNGGNKREAARVAGYGESTIGNPSRLMTPAVKEYIGELTSALEARGLWQAEDIQRFWISLIENQTVNTQNKLKASELLAKSKGLFIERTQLSGGLEIVVRYDRDG